MCVGLCVAYCIHDYVDYTTYNVTKLLHDWHSIQFAEENSILNHVNKIWAFLEIQKLRRVMRNKSFVPGCDRFWRIATSFFNCASCLVGNRSLSITLIAAARAVFRCTAKIIRINVFKKPCCKYQVESHKSLNPYLRLITLYCGESHQNFLNLKYININLSMWTRNSFQVHHIHIIINQTNRRPD